MKGLLQWLLDLLYPRKCISCEELLAGTEQWICQGCKKKLPYIGQHYCIKCGKFLEEEEREFCADCKAHSHNFTQNRGIFHYDRHMKRMVYRFKYQNQRYIGEYFAEEVVFCLGEQIKKWKVDGCIPVPLHKSREKVRGFNQSRLILQEVSKRLGLPMYTDIIVREKKTLPQKVLDRKGREKNLKNAFKMGKNGVKLKRVLLLDDIYTTGSTLDAIARTLQDAGVEEIYTICICIGEGR